LSKYNITKIITIFSYVNQGIVLLFFDVEQQLFKSFGAYK